MSNPGNDESTGDDEAAEDQSSQDSEVFFDPELIENKEAKPRRVDPNIVLEEHQRKIQRWILAIVAGLIAFCVGATLLATVLSSTDIEAQIAGDIAKLSIPTLLAGLTGAAAWAYPRK